MEGTGSRTGPADGGDDQQIDGTGRHRVRLMGGGSTHQALSRVCNWAQLSTPRSSDTGSLQQHANVPTTQQLIDDLHELIRALDLRVPHLERTGEVGIAHD